MPTEYTLEIAGTEYPWDDLRYVRDFKFYGKLIEAIIPEWVAAIAGDDAITIKREGVAVTSGKVKKVAPFEGVSKGMGMVVTGYTKEQKHATLLSNARVYNVDPHDIIVDDLGSTDLTDGTTNPYGSNIVVEFGSNDESKFSRKQVYEEVAFITGWELYVNPAGVLDFKSQCGVDRSASVAFKHGELLESWHKPHMLNHLVKKTKVIVLGACEAEFEYYGIAGSGTDVYTIQRKNLIDNNTCTLAAAAVYADIQNTLKVGVMDVIDTYADAAYDVYDTVHVADPRFGLDENVRIYRIERHVDKKGEHTRIFYTNITKLTCNGQFLLDLAEGELAAGQRTLRDFARVRHSGSYLGAGASFPTTRLITGDTFQLTADIPSTHLAAFYQYDDATSTWNRQPSQFRRTSNPTYGQLEGDLNENTTDYMVYQWTGSAWLRKTIRHTEGTSLPGSGMINGDTFYLTTTKLLYTYDGSSWGDPVTRSHDALTDVGGSDHHSVFTSSQHAAIEHAASMMAIEIRPWTSNFNVAWDDIDYNDLDYGKAGAETTTDADIKFADGTTDLINQSGEVNVPDGLWYLYWDENFKTGGDYDVKRTNDILVAVGTGKGLLATVLVDAAGEKPPGVIPWGGYQPYISCGFLAARSIDAGYLAADFVLGDVEISTGAGVQWAAGGNPGVIITDLGLRGKGAAGAIMAELLASDGKITAAGGDVILDSYGISVVGEKIRFRDSIYYGYIGADHANTRLKIRGAYSLMMDFSNPGKFMFLNGDVQMFGEHSWVPQSAGLGYVGTSAKWFREVHATDLFGNPHLSVVTSKPSPGSGYAGRVIRVRTGSGAKTYVYVCVQNDANAWEWVQIGVST